MGERLLDVTILGEPVGQGRPRAVRTGALGVRMHPPKRSAEWEALAAQQMGAAWRSGTQRAPHNGPVRLYVEAIAPRPKKMPKKLGTGRLWRTARPDLSNIVKSVEDALVKGGVIRDDCLVATLEAKSCIASAQDSAHVLVRLEVIEPIRLEGVEPPRPASPTLL